MKKNKMKKFGFMLMLMLTSMVTALHAQETKEQRYARIHAVKVAYISDKIKLTTSQAEHFWPVYNKYEKELRTLRKAAKQYKDDLKFQEDVLNLRKRYRDEFLKIITEEQLQSMYDAERDFKTLLLQQLKHQTPNKRNSPPAFR